MGYAVGRPARFAARWAHLLSGHSLRTMVLFGLVALIVLTAAGAAVVYRAIALTSQTNEQIVQTTEIRSAGQTLVELIGDAQDGERGFLLTGNERFLEPYTDALTAVPQTANQLYALLDDRVQIERLRGIESLFARWRDQTAQAEIAARRAAPPGYAAASRAAAAEATRLRESAAAYAAPGGGESLRTVHEQATVLRDHISAVLRMTPTSLVSPDSPRAVALLDGIAGARADAPRPPLAQAAAAVETITRRHALDAETAESKVMTFIAGRSPQTAADAVRRQYAAFAAAVDGHLASQLASARAATRLAEAVAVVMPLALMALLLVGFYHASGATGAIDGMIDASRGIAAGDLTRRVAVERGDEIGQLAAAFNDMADQIAIRDRRSALLRQMSEILEASASVEEALGVVGRYVQEMFPDTFGGVYLIKASRDLVEMATSWGADRAHPLPTAFAPDDCWALRRGQVHAVDAQRGGVICRHTSTPPPAASLCLPLTAQGDTLGVLLIAAPAAAGDGHAGPALSIVSEPMVALARAAGDRAGLAIANLKLTETLRAQSVRDPLTGVYNRRYLEETLEREIRRAERTHHDLGLIMFDIDGFKRFNDTLGHEAGDAYLREIGGLLREQFRREDVVCRYGGDEFVIVLPEASLEATMQRAQLLGDAVRDLVVAYHGQSMGSASLSSGVAAFPQHGATGEEVLRAADAALYRAKQNGRARAEFATAAPAGG
ncbi:MAG: diguanylate cyclase [bacterium]